MNVSSLVLAAAILALAGCAKAASSVPACASVTPPPGPILVSPAPGSTGVSTTIGSLTILNFSNPETGFLQPGNPGSSNISLTPPLNAPPAGALISVPVLAANTTYTVFATIPSFNPCNTGESAAHLPGGPGPIGSFTTQ